MGWIVSHLLLIVSGLGLGGIGVLSFLYPQIALEIGKGLLNIAGAVFKAVGRFLRSLDAQGWVGLVVALLLGFTALHFAIEARHWRKQDGRDVKALGIEQAHDAEIAKHAVDLKTQIDALTSNISAKIKERHNEDVAHNAADARDLGLRGPGKAACPGNPGPSAPAGGHISSSSAADAPGPSLPATDRAAVPWDWLIGRAQEHDDLLSEVKAWRDDDAQLRKAWPKSDQKGK